VGSKEWNKFHGLSVILYSLLIDSKDRQFNKPPLLLNALFRLFEVI
jgi:hypothetical protein